MKTYLVKDLNNPEITKIERRTQEPKNSLGPAPEGEEACWLYKCPEDGRVKVDKSKKAQILHEREEEKKKIQANQDQAEARKSQNYYGTINQEDLMKSKSFDDLKRYILYLLDQQGVS